MGARVKACAGVVGWRAARGRAARADVADVRAHSPMTESNHRAKKWSSADRLNDESLPAPIPSKRWSSSPLVAERWVDGGGGGLGWGEGGVVR